MNGSLGRSLGITALSMSLLGVALIRAADSLAHAALAGSPGTESETLLAEAFAIDKITEVALSVAIVTGLFGLLVIARQRATRGVASDDDLSSKLVRLAAQLADAEHELRDRSTQADSLARDAATASAVLSASRDQLAAIREQFEASARPGLRVGWLSVWVGVAGVVLSVALFYAQRV